MDLRLSRSRFFAGFSVLALLTSGCSPVGSPFGTGGSRELSSIGTFIPPIPRPSIAPNLETCRSSPSAVNGVDVSAWNPSINWNRAKIAGKDFVFIKATEGSGYVSATFDGDWAEAKAAGLVRGAYHFFRPSADPVEQAELFLKTMGDLGLDDLPAMLDWEETDGISPAVQIQKAKTWLLLVEQATGKIPVIYTGPSFWNVLGNPSEFIRHALFIANYRSPCPYVPAPWSQWTFWQHTDQGIVDGSSTDLDLDIFNGSKNDLLRFARFGFL